jgi:hypothetical protein
MLCFEVLHKNVFVAKCKDKFSREVMDNSLKFHLLQDSLIYCRVKLKILDKSIRPKGLINGNGLF